MKTNIIKVKNFEGHVYYCSCCGRELMHAYRLNGSGAILGAACILKGTASQKTAKAEIKIADARREKFERDGARLAVELGMNIIEVEAGILDGSIS